MKKVSKCFISYSQKDSSFVNQLIMDLHYSDIDVTYDRIELKVGDSIIEKISHIINATMIIIPIISKNSINSNWVSKELSLSLTAEISSQAKVFPVKIDETKMPYSLGDKLYADFFKNYYYGLRDLVRSINPDFYRANRRKNQKIDLFEIN